MINVLSLFDGIAGARVALDRLGIPCTYYASEIDKYASQIARKNYPDIIQSGDIQQINPFLLPPVDLLIGGSPCQDLSGAGRGAGLNGSRSVLFFDYVRLLKYLKPRYFVLENVKSMNKLNRFIISSFMGVEPIMIDSALVSAQSRKRLYWTNLPVEQPEDRGILLKDIIESGVVDRDKSYCIDAYYFASTAKPLEYYQQYHRRQIVFDQEKVRRLVPLECERLQTFSDGYTEGISNTQRYKCLGNAFTVEVIRHILSFADF